MIGHKGEKAIAGTLAFNQADQAQDLIGGLRRRLGQAIEFRQHFKLGFIPARNLGDVEIETRLDQPSSLIDVRDRRPLGAVAVLMEQIGTSLVFELLFR